MASPLGHSRDRSSAINIIHRVIPSRNRKGGAVECRFEKIDTVEEIVDRVEEAMKYVDKDRLSINPDCGFAPGIDINMPLDEPYQKLKNVRNLSLE